MIWKWDSQGQDASFLSNVKLRNLCDVDWLFFHWTHKLKANELLDGHRQIFRRVCEAIIFWNILSITVWQARTLKFNFWPPCEHTARSHAWWLEGWMRKLSGCCLSDRKLKFRRWSLEVCWRGETLEDCDALEIYSRPCHLITEPTLKIKSLNTEDCPFIDESVRIIYELRSWQYRPRISSELELVTKHRLDKRQHMRAILMNVRKTSARLKQRFFGFNRPWTIRKFIEISFYCRCA